MDNSHDQISNLWDELQSSNRLPKGTLTTACEVELQELMRQIDIMVNKRKQEWEKEVETLKLSLKSKDKEIKAQSACLRKKDQEVEKLNEKLEERLSSQDELVSQYEEQITILRKEVQRMKKDYDRLQRKQLKNSKDVDKDNDKMVADQQQTALEVSRLKAKLEDYQQASRDWDSQKRSLQNQIENLEAQRKALYEKCDFIQQQSKSYQGQIERRRQIIDSSELNLKTQITQLEGQLERANNTITVQEEKLDRLKEGNDEVSESVRASRKDNDRLLEDLKRANSKIQILETERHKLSEDVQSQEGIIDLLKADLEQKGQDVVRMEQTLNDKDAVIRSLTESSRSEDVKEVVELKTDLQAAEQKVRKLQMNDGHLREQISTLQTENDRLIKDFEDLCHQLSNKTEELTEGKSEISHLRNEISQLREKLDMVEGTNLAEFEGMRNELASLTTELHSRTKVVSQLREESARMKKQLGQTEAMKLLQENEIQDTHYQLQALREENEALRRSAAREDQARSEVTKLKQHIDEMSRLHQNHWKQAEMENHLLHDEISILKSEFSPKISRLPVDTQNQHNQPSSVFVDSGRLSPLRPGTSERTSWKQTLIESGNTTEDSGKSSQVWSGRDTVVLREHSSTLTQNTASRQSPDLDRSVAESFLMEENARVSELEKLIDKHIDDLKLNTDAVLQNWAH